MEVVVANVEADGETNSGPDRVAATDPGLEAEHVLGVDTKLANLLSICGKSNEVFGNILLFGGLEEPLLCGVGICGCLGGSEGLGGNEEEGRLGVRVLEGFGNVGAVDIGDEVQLHVAVTVCLEGF